MQTSAKSLVRSVGMELAAAMVLLAVGCGPGEELDLQQLPLVSEDDSVGAALASKSLTWVRPSALPIFCIRFPCPNTLLYDVNTGQSELAYAYDWRALGLDPTEQQSLESKASQMLLYGRYTMVKVYGEWVNVFQVARANLRVSEQSVDNPGADRYYALSAADDSCQQPPCWPWKATLLNRSKTEQWRDLDLGRLGLNPDAQKALLGELQKGQAYVSAYNVSVMPVALTEAFRPYGAVPLPSPAIKAW